MLAAPLFPSAPFASSDNRDAPQYQPAKDLEAFNKLLPPPIEFVEGSSSGSLVLGEGKYKPINVPSSVKAAKDSKPEIPSSWKDQPETPSEAASSAKGADKKILFSGTIDPTWPPHMPMGCGLNNIGNTCFLNSALQCLLHTPPLLRILASHSTPTDPCRVRKNAFCMVCSLRKTMLECFKSHTSLTPYLITSNLTAIAKHLRRGRQEDSHEFLRYAIDALQKSCLAGHPPKLDPKIAETTWVHKIFGGKLRSRVTCMTCGYNSDTFDSILDLSVDIFRAGTLEKALRTFVAIDHLKGADKYKCEKCKKPVNADKQFTVHEAPVVLSVHLKRFTPMGRKISTSIDYKERFSLKPFMSEGSFGPTYSLYGVISHSGSGPNSGHYYAHIKNAQGQWYEMNDEIRSRVTGAPVNLKNAYILFYVQDKGQALEAAVSIPANSTLSPALPIIPKNSGLVAGMKKRKIVQSDDEGPSPKKTAPFIGPLLPSSVRDASKPAVTFPDPQAAKLKEKIAAATKKSTSGALQSLSQYKDDSSEEDDIGEKMDEDPEPSEPTAPTTLSSSALIADPHTPSSPTATVGGPRTPSSPAAEPPVSTPAGPSSPHTPPTSVFSPIPSTNFYGSSVSKGKEKERGELTDKKRKSPERDDDDDDEDSGSALSRYARTPLSETPRKKLGASSPLYPHRNSNFKNRSHSGVTHEYGKPSVISHGHNRPRRRIPII